MSIYFLRHGDLIKIGYSTNLGLRVSAIIAAIPGDVTFLGHMPGDRDVEAHFHALFHDQRFSGEWFHTSPRLEALVDAALIPDQPKPDYHASFLGHRRRDRDDQWSSTSVRVREFTARRWPLMNLKQRIAAAAQELNWSHRRMRSLVNNEPGMTLREVEAEDLAEWMKAGPVPLTTPPTDTTKGD